MLTAPIATKSYLDRESIGPCFFLTRPRLVEDFAGHPQTEDHAEAVVVGDMGNLITFQHLNTAFRLLLSGARFVTMSRIVALVSTIHLVVVGVKIRQRRWWTFCYLTGWGECLMFPFGTILGIFTIIVLGRPSVKKLFGVR